MPNTAWQRFASLSMLVQGNKEFMRQGGLCACRCPRAKQQCYPGVPARKAARVGWLARGWERSNSTGGSAQGFAAVVGSPSTKKLRGFCWHSPCLPADHPDLVGVAAEVAVRALCVAPWVGPVMYHHYLQRLCGMSRPVAEREGVCSFGGLPASAARLSCVLQRALLD